MNELCVPIEQNDIILLIELNNASDCHDNGLVLWLGLWLVVH